MQSNLFLIFSLLSALRSVGKAYEFVRSRRPEIMPRAMYIRQLQACAKQLGYDAVLMIWLMVDDGGDDYDSFRILTKITLFNFRPSHHHASPYNYLPAPLF
jgi:hypothetical protein